MGEAGRGGEAGLARTERARRPTAFEERVYEVLRGVPRGRVTTYGMLGRAVGCGSARAIGQALRRNPYAPEVPCHRVIRSDLRIGGFGGEAGGKRIREKVRLLAEEGVEFRGGKLAEGWRVMGEREKGEAGHRARQRGRGRDTSGRDTSGRDTPRPYVGRTGR